MKFLEMIFPKRLDLSKNLLTKYVIILLIMIFFIIFVYWDGIIGKREMLFVLFSLVVLILLSIKSNPFILYIMLIISVTFLAQISYYKGFISYFHGIHVINDPIWITFFVGYIFYRLNTTRKGRAIIRDPIIPVFILFFIVSIFHSLFIGNFWFNVIWESRLYLYGVFLYMVMLDYLDDVDEIRWLIILIFTIGFVTSLITLYQYQFTTTRWEYAEGVYRLPSIFGGPNQYAGFLELVIPLTLSYFLFSEKLREKVVYITLLLILFLCMILTMSRGGLMGALIGVGVVWLKFNKKATVILGLVLVLILFVLSVTITQGILARQLSTIKAIYGQSEYEFKMGDLALAVRAVEYSRMWEHFTQNPLFGIGWGLYELPGLQNIAHLCHYRISHTPIYYFNHHDNAYLDMAHKGGIFVILSFLAILIIGFVKINRAAQIDDIGVKKIAIGILGSVIGFSTHQLMDGIIRQQHIYAYFWFLFASGIFLYYKYYKKENET